MSPAVLRRQSQTAIGERFSEWTVVAKGERVNGAPAFLCRCSCGTERTVPGYSLRDGRSKSCGCVRPGSRKPLLLRRGILDSYIYTLWRKMCKQKSHGVYGPWRNFDRFYADTYGRPKQTKMRLKVDSYGYFPQNISWGPTGQTSKLTEQRVRRIAKLLASGEPVYRISTKLSVSQGHVRRIKNRLDIEHVGKFRKYDLTLAEFEKMLADQQHKCAICPDALTKNSARVDHCHGTGMVRGLLCGKCNSGLGMFADSTDSLLAAISYLRKSRQKIAA